MALISGSGPTPPHPARDGTPTTPADDPRRAFRWSLSRLSLAELRLFAERRGFEPEAEDSAGMAAELVDQLDDPAVAATIRERLDDDERLAVGLFGLTESPRWPARGLRHALSVLGASAEEVVNGLLERGLLAVAADGPVVDLSSPQRTIIPDGPDFLIHPALASGARIHPPTDPPPPICEAVVQIREGDGLEPILRLAALWQRVGAEPIRLTQTGALYKRDRERIADDAVISAPFRDASADASDPAGLLMELAKRIGLIRLDQSRELLTASPADFWAENAVHLPQMIASAWLSLRSWREWTETESSASSSAPAIGEPLIYLRPALMLWLAGLEPEDWVTLDDLAEHLATVFPEWDRLSFRDDFDESEPRRARRERRPPRGGQAKRVLERVLLGGAGAMGLVRAAEEKTTGRKAVQLTALGRYALRVDPPPTAPPPFEKFLFAQPNLDVIAYRQGLTPRLIGSLSQFAWWTKIDAAIEMRLTRESIAGGLQWGMSVDRMLEILTRHSQTPLPSALKDAVERWASHRERVVFYEAATLIEFDSRSDRDQAVERWTTGDDESFIPVGERFILVEDPRDVPTGRISTTAARDYRLPPERCVTVEEDGVTLVLDPSRTDLLIDAELGRFADERPAFGPDPADPLRPTERRFIITPASLRRGRERGLTPALLADWFARRAGAEPPPAVKLMERSPQARTKPWTASRRLVLNVPSAELLDGVMQHPMTRSRVGDRLGPVSVEVPEEYAEELRAALKELGVEVEIS